MADNPPRENRAGRPSLAATRRRQIIDAFVRLVAERGLGALTLDDVAAASGVQRSVIRHYVGNRDNLIDLATQALVERYIDLIRTAIGQAPRSRTMIDHMFSADWVTGMATEDRALDELFRHATRDRTTRTRLQSAYALLVDELAIAIRRDHPAIDQADAVRAAYAVVCLAEHNTVMQQLGFPAELAAGAHETALTLASGNQKEMITSA